MKYKHVSILFLGLSLTLCMCITSICGIAYLYGYYIGGDWSDFSTLENASDVESILREKLAIGSSNVTDVASFLKVSGVNYCGIYKNNLRVGGLFLQESHILDLHTVQAGNVLIVCGTGIRESILDSLHHLGDRNYNLLIEYRYRMRFYFVDGVLNDVRVTRTGSGP